MGFDLVVKSNHLFLIKQKYYNFLPAADGVVR